MILVGDGESKEVGEEVLGVSLFCFFNFEVSIIFRKLKRN